MFDGTCMRHMLDEIKLSTETGNLFQEAIVEATARRAKAGAGLARVRWKEFVDDFLGGSARGAHAVSKKVYAEAVPVFDDGDPGSPPVPLVGQPALDQLLKE